MIERQEFIDAMRGVANSVTIVTTDGIAGRHGATVSAFCSVSADPPTILVCLNAASRISKTVMKNRKFRVTVLPEYASHLADRFAGHHDNSDSDRFAGIETNDGISLIEAATMFDCELENTMMSGSHQIMIGKVVICKSGDCSPLTYLNGAYHAVTRFPQAAE